MTSTFWQTLDRIGTIATIIASAALVWLVAFRPAVQARDDGSEFSGSISAELARSAATDGKPSADSAVIEFSDYFCPFCARSASQLYPQIKKELVDSGKAKYMFINFPLQQIHPHAVMAAKAAECAGEQRQFWAMHERLFANQKTLAMQDWKGHADALKLDLGQFDSCLQSTRTTDKINQQIALGRQLDVRSTPTFLIGTVQPDGSIKLKKKVEGAVPFDDVKRAVSD